MAELLQQERFARKAKSAAQERSMCCCEQRADRLDKSFGAALALALCASAGLSVGAPLKEAIKKTERDNF